MTSSSFDPFTTQRDPRTLLTYTTRERLQDVSGLFLTHLLAPYHLKADETFAIARLDAKRRARAWLPGEPASFGAKRVSHVETGVFLRNQTGPYFKTSAPFMTAVWGIMLDDVGTEKVPRPPLLDPTFVIETSPGNQQWGYAFTRLCEDKAHVTALAKGIADAGFTDRGAKGSHRLVRVPGACPAGKKHRARLVAFSGKRYDPWTLHELLGCDLVHGRVRKSTFGGRTHATPFDKAAIEDPFMDALCAHDLVRADDTFSDEGWIDVMCPFCEEHSDPEKPWARYRPRFANEPRILMCFHSHPDRPPLNIGRAWGHWYMTLDGFPEVPEEYL